MRPEKLVRRRRQSSRLGAWTEQPVAHLVEVAFKGNEEFSGIILIRRLCTRQ